MDGWTSTKPVPSGQTLSTAFTWQTSATLYLSNGCMFVGEAGYINSTGTGGISNDDTLVC